MAYPRRGTAGFTLVELVVTVAIVAVLASIGMPLAELAIKRQREQELRSALREVRAAIDAYKLAADQGRIARSAEQSGYPASLDLLVLGMEDMRSKTKERIYFLRRLPRDPTFPDATVPAAKTWGKRSYASPPDAPREGDDVYDIYSLSPGAGLNGVDYRYW